MARYEGVGLMKVETKTYEEAVEVEWKIDNFASLVDRCHTSDCYSNTFSFANASWNLKLWPKSLTIPPGFMCVNLYINVCRDYPVEYKYGLRKVDGSVEQLFTGILKGGQNRSSDDSIIKLSEVLRRKSELAPSNVLTIICNLSLAPKLCMLDTPKLEKLMKLDTLSENFKDLFLNEDSCDTTLCVKNIEYKVHKTILIARSSVFAAMFQHEMSEKQTGIVDIPDCDPSSFKEFLQFLYCGQLEELSFDSALHLYETSDKYGVQELKTFCTEFLSENLTPENFCEVLILADKYDDTELLSATQDYFNENLNNIFQSSEWECLTKKDYRLANKLLKKLPKMKALK